MSHIKSRWRNASISFIVLAVGILTVAGCRNPSGADYFPVVPVTVTVSVAVPGPTFRGANVVLKADVSNAPSGYGLAWSIGSGHKTGTEVTGDEKGAVLEISADEPDGTKITVRAELVGSPNRFGTLTLTIKTAPFTVESVTVEPVDDYEATVARGRNAVFRAVVLTDPQDDPDARGTVMWQISGGIPGDGILDQDDNEVLLTVSDKVPNVERTFILRAVSDDPGRVRGEVTVTVPVPEVTGLTIDHEGHGDEAFPGGHIQFRADVAGNHNPPTEVNWHRSGNRSSGTEISATGLLTMGADEPADNAVSVWAVSAFDGDVKSDEIEITVLPPPSFEVESVTINTVPTSGLPVSLDRGTGLTFSATPSWVDPGLAPLPPWEFRWEVVGDAHPLTGFDPEL
ncbi:MAG: hypothetical protein FWD94_01315, partial [Treponema sp.]|nr:hypothetical protein [Treponema sp.]